MHTEPDPSPPLAPGAPGPTPLRLAPWPALDPARPFDYHLHTDHTDGTASIRAMAEAAQAAHLDDMLFSEHVRRTSTYHAGFAAEVRALDLPGLAAYVGAEAKILDLEGTLDCPPEVYARCDAVIGSVHSAPPGADGTPRRWSALAAAEAAALELALGLAIVRGSRAHILGHPMGICISRLGLLPWDELRQLAAACREHGKAFELNARYCADTAAWIAIAQEAGCMVSIGSDAHHPDAVGSGWRRFVKKA